LRHEPVIRRYHQNGYVGKVCPTLPNLGKSRMTGSIEKSYLLILMLDLVCPYVLGNSTRFSSYHVRLAYGIEKGRLSMVNVTKNTNYGRTGLKKLLVILIDLFLRFFLNRFRFFSTMLDFQLETLDLGYLPG